MDPNVATRIAEQAAVRYALLLEGFRGALAATLSGRDPFSERGRTGLRAQVYAMAESWLLEEAPRLVDEIMSFGEGGVAAVEDSLEVLREDPSEEVLDHLRLVAEHLDRAMRVQIERDAGIALGALRDAALRTSLSARTGSAARGIPAVIRQDAVASLRFEFRDRSGKRWPSQRHVKVLWRHALVLAWNEAALLAMAERGVDWAVIEHDDPQHAERGTRVTLAERPDGVLWSEIRDEVFHPNTHAWVRPALDDV